MRRGTPRAATEWNEIDILALNRLWRAFLPVSAIARELGRPRPAVQAMVRRLDLPHRPPEGVAYAARTYEQAQANARQEMATAGYARRIGAAEAKHLALHMGVAWHGRPDDHRALNAALDAAGEQPVYVPFRELRG